MTMSQLPLPLLIKIDNRVGPFIYVLVHTDHGIHHHERYNVEIRYNNENRKKTYSDYLIHKIQQILKRFAGTFS